MALKEVGKTQRGYTIYVEDNEVGGHRYWSDEVGGGVMIWDTSLVCPESMELAILLESGFHDSIQRGDNVIKSSGDYIFEGKVAAVYQKIGSKQYRLVVEDDRGLNLIMNPRQVKKVDKK